MNLRTCAVLVHGILLDLRGRLEDGGASRSTVLAAEVTLAHLLPLLLAGSWTGTCQDLADRCGRSSASIRRALRVLERAGAIHQRLRGPYGIELTFLLDHRDQDEEGYE